MSDSKPEERYTDANRLIERGWKVATKFAPHYFYNVLGLFIRLFLLVGFVWMGHSMVSLSSGDHPIHYLTPFFLFLFPLSLMVTSLKRHIWSFLHLLVLIFLMCFAIWTWWRPEFPNLSSFYLVICLCTDTL